MQGKQVFQTDSSVRWKRFKWGSRFILLMIPLAILFLVLTYVYLFIPEIPAMRAKEVFGRSQNFLSRNSELAKKYKGFRQYISRKETGRRNAIDANMPCAIRSAFYVTWNKSSFASLRRNIDKLNLVIPEWIFINPEADTLFTNIDAPGLAVMKNAGVGIMPMLSNVFPKDNRFHGEAVHRIITNKFKRERLINDLIAILQKNNFKGVNVDFEELVETTDDTIIAFQKELYEKLHAKGLLVTQDVIPFNEDYNYAALSKYNDLLFVMAYDEYSKGSKPGPIADQKWIEAAVDYALKKIPPKKIVLGMAAYGYDWAMEEQATAADVTDLTYETALTTAKENQSKIEFDNDTYNLHFSYYDDDSTRHEAYFTDAATTFNAMRFATESAVAGVALWRLGSEDERIWQFYSRDMRRDSISSFDFQNFSHIRSNDDVINSGAGEVLDVVSTATGKQGTILPDLDSSEMLIAEENYDSLPSSFIAKKFGWNSREEKIRNRKKLVLTFDDGPDPTWTPKILDVLSEKKVPAAFFIVGMNAENNIPLVKRIYREGFEIGNHTFTHPNIAEVGRRWAIIEMESTRLLIECITGHSTILFRAPYNADFTPENMEELLPVAIARTQNYLDVGESIDPLDWEPGVTADTIFARVVRRKAQVETDEKSLTGGNIILLHDAGGDSRKATLQALPRIIDYFRQRGYTFTTIADLIGKKKEELMPPVPRGSGYYLIEASYLFLEITYYTGHTLFTLFVIFIALSMVRILAMGAMILREKRKATELLPVAAYQEVPLVSIIVPAYNEEVNAVASLQNLLRTDYPNFDVVFVDDGSTDDTYEKVREVFAHHPKVRVLTKKNGGKASALNFGIAQSSASYVVCIDADTKLKQDAVSQLMKHFLADGENRIGAVAGNVKVGNEVNLLTRWQAIEYISSQNFDRLALGHLNAITVVPGAIGAFRKTAIESAGGFTTDTLAEDCDLTIRIIREGYLVKNENAALAFTEAPEKLKQFIKQRFRWNFGILQAFWKHKEILFNRKYKWLGCFAMPNILLFQYIIPAFIPLADLFMLLGLVTGNAAHILPYYFAFMLVDAAVSVIAFRMEKENFWKLIWLLPQRLIYRWLMWWVLFKSVRRAIKGEMQSWGVLKRTGRVKELDMQNG